MNSLMKILALKIAAYLVASLATYCYGQEDLDQFIHTQRVAYSVPPEVAPTPMPMVTGLRSGGTVSYYAADSYPTHSVSWHIIGSRESRQELINHLMTHPEHANVRSVYTANDLHRMSRHQLQTLHDDSHNRRIARYTRAVTVAAPTVVTSQVYLSPPASYSAPRVSNYTTVRTVREYACPPGMN
jgi:hypothetical protein